MGVQSDAMVDEVEDRVGAPTERLSLARDAPEAYRAMLVLDATIKTCPIEQSLRELIKIRVSQINGCAFCLDMHTQDALAAGEEEARLRFLPAWREAPVFTERERAALALSEAITVVSAGHVPDDVYARATQYFSREEVAWLIMAAVTINAFNRMAIAARHPRPGSYSSRRDVS
jgi:AhpD family alkylhydroperoxidase